MITTAQPWGLSRSAPYPNVAELPFARVEIDAATQTARYLDPSGRPITMGGHGTSTSGVTPTQTTPGDGSGPGGATDSDSHESYDQDESG